MATSLQEFAYQAGALVSSAGSQSSTSDAKLDRVLTLLESGSAAATTVTLSGTSRSTSVQVVSNPDRGMSANDGRVLGESEHIRQSLSDIFRTPVGSCVMRREYGSDLHELIDAPMNESTEMAIIAAAADAALRWEPRIKMLLVTVKERGPSGRFVLGVGAEDLAGNAVDFDEVYAS